MTDVPPVALVPVLKMITLLSKKFAGIDPPLFVSIASVKVIVGRVAAATPVALCEGLKVTSPESSPVENEMLCAVLLFPSAFLNLFAAMVTKYLVLSL